MSDVCILAGSRTVMLVPTREHIVNGGILPICFASLRGRATRSSLQMGMISQLKVNL